MTPAPLARAQGYRLAALALGYPDPQPLRQVLAEIAEEAPGACAALAAELSPLVDDDLPGEHNRLFSQRAPVPPYESSYLPGDKGIRLGQLATLYELFGARAGGAEHETVEHIGVQLEFAALLCLKEAEACEADRSEHVEMTRRARQVLLEEHLGRWVGRFTEKLAERAEHPFYARLAPGLAALIDEDLRRHGWSVAPADCDGCEVTTCDDDEPMTCPLARGTDEDDVSAP